MIKVDALNYSLALFTTHKLTFPAIFVLHHRHLVPPIFIWPDRWNAERKPVWLVGWKQGPCCLHSDPIERGHNAFRGDVRSMASPEDGRGRNGRKRWNNGGYDWKESEDPWEMQKEIQQGVGLVELETWLILTHTHTRLSLSPPPTTVIQYVIPCKCIVKFLWWALFSLWDQITLRHWPGLVPYMSLSAPNQPITPRPCKRVRWHRGAPPNPPAIWLATLCAYACIGLWSVVMSVTV